MWPRRLLLPGEIDPASLLILFVAALATSLLLLLVFFPGPISDGHAIRWAQVYGYVEGKQSALFNGHHSPLLAASMLASYLLTGGMLLFTALHYFLILLASLGLAYVLLGNAYAAAAVVGLSLLLLPPAFLAVLTVTADGFVYAGLALVLAVILIRPRQPWIRALLLGILVLGGLIGFGFRYNSIAIFPILTASAWLTRRTPGERFSLCVCIFFSCILAVAANRFIQKGQSHPLNSALAWELVGAMAIANSAELAEGLEHIGDFDAAMKRFSFEHHGRLVWGRAAPLDRASLKREKHGVRRAWIRAVTEKPWCYVRVKIGIWRRLLGLDLKTIGLWEFDGSPKRGWAGKQLTRRGESLQMHPAARAVVNAEARATKGLPALTWPFLAMLVGAAAAWLLARTGGNRGAAAVIMIVFAAYYGTFFLITPSTVFRYAVPTYMASGIVTVAALWGAVRG